MGSNLLPILAEKENAIRLIVNFLFSSILNQICQQTHMRTISWWMEFLASIKAVRDAYVCWFTRMFFWLYRDISLEKAQTRLHLFRTKLFLSENDDWSVEMPSINRKVWHWLRWVKLIYISRKSSYKIFNQRTREKRLLVHLITFLLYAFPWIYAST